MAKTYGSTLIRPIGIAASILGIVQGLIWFLLGLVAIFYHHEVIEEPSEDSTSYHRELFRAIYYIYLTNKNGSLSVDITIKGEGNGFYVISWLYCVLSFLWFIWSSWQLWVLQHRKWSHAAVTICIWVVLSGIFLLMDLAIFGILANDYHVLLHEYTNEVVDVFVILACGTMMSLIIRGYILWLLNLTLTVILTIFATKLIRSRSPTKANDTEPIHAYSPSRYSQPPWITEESNGRVDPWIANPRSSNLTNRAFDLSSEPSNSIRARSFLHTVSQENGNNRVATIGSKNKFRKPTNSVQGPMIPDPDYTPPVSPTVYRKPVLKSVLKNRTQY